MSALVEGIEIWAIEFDVRVEEAASLDVEIFTKAESFTEDMSDETAWTKVADTQAKVTPDGTGVMISEKDFTPIAMQSLQRRAIYIQMKGPWIDVKAEALDKTGELQKQTKEMVVFVGAGINSRFSSEIDPLVDPQFAGRIHYRRSFPCSEGILTKISFPLLIGQIPNPFLIGLLQETLDEILETKILKVADVVELVSQFNLRFGETTQIDTFSSDITCPNDWSYCPSVVIDASLKLRHDDGLRPGQLRFQIYRLTEAIIRELQARLELDEVMYLGLQPTAASFVMTIDPAPDTSLERDIEFFEESTTNYLNIEFDQNSLQVFDTVTSSEFQRRNLRRTLSTGTTISGSILGAQAAYLPLSNFIVELNMQLNNEKQLYMDMLQFGVSTLPNGDSVSSDAFLNVQNIQATFYYEKITPVSFELPTSPAFTMKTFLIIFPIILVVIIPLILYYGCKHKKSIKAYKESVEEYRAQMREFRRKKKEDCSVEGTTAKSLEENFTTELDAAFELGYEEYKKKVEVCGLNALSHHDLAENETSLHKTSEHGRAKLARSISSHSSLSLSLNRLDVESDLEDDMSDDSFGTDTNDNDIDDTSVASDARSIASNQTNKSQKSLLAVFMEKQVEKQQRQGLCSSASSLRLSKSSLEGSLKSLTEHVPKRGLSYMGSQYGDARPGTIRSRSGHVGTINCERPPPQRRVAPRSKSFDSTLPLDPSFQRDLNKNAKESDANWHLKHSSTHQQDSRRNVCSSDSKSCKPGLRRTSSNQSLENARKAIPSLDQALSVKPGKLEPDNGDNIQSQLSHRLHHLLPPSAQTEPRDRPVHRPTRQLSSGSIGLGGDARRTPRRAQPRRENNSLFPQKSSHNIVQIPYQTDPRPTNDTSKEPVPTPARMPARTKSAPISEYIQDELLRHRKVLADEFLDSDDSSSSSTEAITESSPSSSKEQSTKKKKMSTDMIQKKLDKFHEEKELSKQDFNRSEHELTVSSIQSLDRKKKKKSSMRKGKKKKKKSKKRLDAQGKDGTKSEDCHGYDSEACASSTTSISSGCDLSVGAHSLDENILSYGRTKAAKHVVDV
jgi:hypothetical protein